MNAPAKSLRRNGTRLTVTPRIKVWLEGEDGAVVMGSFRAELLGHVAETGSLAEAAQRMGLSYRRAWAKVREIEENLGVELVHCEVGGRGGGSSTLTAEGERLVSLYREVERRMRRHLSKEVAHARDA